MSHTEKLVVVPSNGQISIGKTWAGKEVQIEQVSDSQIVITSGAFVPADHATFYSEAPPKSNPLALIGGLRTILPKRQTLKS